MIVAGCLPQRLGPACWRNCPEIDHIVGVFGRDEINRVADHLIGGRASSGVCSAPRPITALDDRARLRITPRHFAYLKISEGCDRTCTFCSIPKMRGKHVTKPIEMVIAEARELAADGVRELKIVAQDTTYYGMDLYGKVRLVELLRELEQVDGIDWIRLMYLYPVNFTDELIDTIAGSSKILPYLDMPLQHIDDAVLKRMQRASIAARRSNSSTSCVRGSQMSSCARRSSSAFPAKRTSSFATWPVLSKRPASSEWGSSPIRSSRGRPP